MIRTDLGAISAWAIARQHGYTGTEEQFAQLLVNSADYAQTAQTAADTATDAAEEAESAKNEILNSIDDTLSQAGKAADAAAVGNLKDALSEYEDGFHNLNLFVHEAELLYEDGYASINNGKISAKQPSTLFNAYILPVDGSSIYSFTSCRFAFLVGADKETAIGSLLQEVTQINSAGASYICFSVNKNTYPLSTYICSKGKVLETGFALPNWSDVLQDQINVVDARVYDLEYSGGVNLFGRAILLSDSGYATIESGKLVVQNQSLYSAYLLPVDGESRYTFTNCRLAFLVGSDKETTIGEMFEDVTEVDSTGASYIAFSFNHNTYSASDYKVYGKIPSTGKQKYISVSGNLSSGNALKLSSARTNLRKNERIVFEGNISSFSSIRIGLTYSDSLDDSNEKNYFDIDGTSISYHAKSSSTAVSVPHGLTIANNVQIIWEMTSVASCKITLISNGNLFEHEFTNFVRQAIGNPFVISNGSSLTGCKLTWTCIDLEKHIWMFGDSYFSYSAERWTYYLHQYGYDKNCLLDGYSGEGGVNGKKAFANLLAFGTPDIAVWCLGMNDETDSSSAPSTSWVTNRDAFLQYCESNNVTPVFGTIPTVPSINHERKNAWIRSSGYRYIDFAKAVGANASGVWYSGMLSNDGVHPTEKGARALFARVLLDLPEIMI